MGLGRLAGSTDVSGQRVAVRVSGMCLIALNGSCSCLVIRCL